MIATGDPRRRLRSTCQRPVDQSAPQPREAGTTLSCLDVLCVDVCVDVCV